MVLVVLQGRAKAEDDKHQKVEQQEHITCKSTQAEAKPAIKSHVLKRNHHSKPAAPVSRPSKPVEQVRNELLVVTVTFSAGRIFHACALEEEKKI